MCLPDYKPACKRPELPYNNNVPCLIPTNHLVTVVKLRLNHTFKYVQGPHDKVLNGHCENHWSSGTRTCTCTYAPASMRLQVCT